MYGGLRKADPATYLIYRATALAQTIQEKVRTCCSVNLQLAISEDFHAEAWLHEGQALRHVLHDCLTRYLNLLSERAERPISHNSHNTGLDSRCSGWAICVRTQHALQGCNALT